MKYSTLLCASLCLLTTAASLGKRSSSRANITPLSSYTQDNFQTSIAESLIKVPVDLQEPTLIHTQDDFVMFINGNQRQNLSILATIYQNLKVVSHLPVSAVSLLLPELLDSGGSLSSDQLTNDTQSTLQQFREDTENLSSLINSISITYFTDKQRQQEIVGRVLSLLYEILDGPNVTITMEYLMTFTESLSGHLRANSHDAVLDYLTCLNDALSSLNLSQDTLSKQLVVVLSAGSLSQTGSFLHQYYEQLLYVKSGSQRLISKPNTFSETQLLFGTTLFQTISTIFYGNSLAPVHDGLSRAASDIICSNDLELYSCFKESTVEGFHTRLEKSYVVIMMVLGGCAVLCGIVLACILYENQLMNTEMKSEETHQKRKLNGPNVFTPVNSLQDFSLEPQLSIETETSLLSRSDSNPNN